MAKKSFVTGGFELPESQGNVQWIDADTLLVGRDFGGGTITESEYPFTTREWKRGTKIEDAPEIFRGDPKDVWAGAGLLRDNTGTIHARTAFRGLSRSEEHTSELQSLIRNSYAVFCLKTQINPNTTH